jgi:hypothetical protein
VKELFMPLNSPVRVELTEFVRFVKLAFAELVMFAKVALASARNPPLVVVEFGPLELVAATVTFVGLELFIWHRNFVKRIKSVKKVEMNLFLIDFTYKYIDLLIAIYRNYK